MKIILVCAFSFAFFLKGFTQFDPQKDTIFWSGEDSISMRKPTAADRYVDIGNFDKAIIEYKKLLAEDPKDDQYRYNLACAYSLNKAIDSSFNYLFIALRKDSSIFPLTDPDLYNLTGDSRWDTIVNKQMQKAFVKNKFQSKNPAINKALYLVQLKDQAYYKEIQIAEMKFGMQSKEAKALWKKKEELNKDNLKKIEEIIKEHGWLKASEYGNIASETLFFVIQHAGTKKQKKYLPLLEQACKEKEADWESYAMMKDRVLVAEKKKQLYGSQLRYNKKKKVYEFAPIHDPEYVNKRRKEMGMSDLQSYGMQWGVEFNVPQKE